MADSADEAVHVRSLTNEGPVFVFLSALLDGGDLLKEGEGHGAHRAVVFGELDVVLAFYTDAADGSNDNGGAHSEGFEQTALGGPLRNLGNRNRLLVDVNLLRGGDLREVSLGSMGFHQSNDGIAGDAWQNRAVGGRCVHVQV